MLCQARQISFSFPLSLLLIRNSIWTRETSPMEFPQKASILMNKHSSEGEEKAFQWRILNQSPLLVLQQGPDFKLLFKTKKENQRHASPKFFLFNSQLSPPWGTSAAQNKRQQYGYLVPSSYWHPVPTRKWELSVFVPRLSSQWGKVFACVPGKLNSNRVDFSFLTCLYTALAEKRSLELVILS